MLYIAFARESSEYQEILDNALNFWPDCLEIFSVG